MNKKRTLSEDCRLLMRALKILSDSYCNPFCWWKIYISFCWKYSSIHMFRLACTRRFRILIRRSPTRLSRICKLALLRRSAGSNPVTVCDGFRHKKALAVVTINMAMSGIHFSSVFARPYRMFRRCTAKSHGGCTICSYFLKRIFFRSKMITSSPRIW